MILAQILSIILPALILYYGYRDDYRRDKKTFWETIVVTVPMLLFTMAFGVLFLILIAMIWRKTQKKN